MSKVLLSNLDAISTNNYLSRDDIFMVDQSDNNGCIFQRSGIEAHHRDVGLVLEIVQCKVEVIWFH